jgi:hypothetical protein
MRTNSVNAYKVIGIVAPILDQLENESVNRRTILSGA